MSTCLFIDFETSGFIRKCMIQILEVWFRSGKLRRTLSCHDRRARVKDSFNEKWHPIIDILALWAPYIGSLGVLMNACWWSHIAYITIPCPEFDHGKWIIRWIKPQIVTFQVGLACLIQTYPEFHEEISRPWDSTPERRELEASCIPIYSVFGDPSQSHHPSDHLNTALCWSLLIAHTQASVRDRSCLPAARKFGNCDFGNPPWM